MRPRRPRWSGHTQPRNAMPLVCDVCDWPEARGAETTTRERGHPVFLCSACIRAAAKALEKRR